MVVHGYSSCRQATCSESIRRCTRGDPSRVLILRNRVASNNLRSAASDPGSLHLASGEPQVGFARSNCVAVNFGLSFVVDI